MSARNNSMIPSVLGKVFERNSGNREHIKLHGRNNIYTYILGLFYWGKKFIRLFQKTIILTFWNSFPRCDEERISRTKYCTKFRSPRVTVTTSKCSCKI